MRFELMPLTDNITPHDNKDMLAQKLREIAEKEEEIRIQAENLKLQALEISSKQNAVTSQNQKLKAAYRKLKELDRFKESLTSMIVHDLKNPLNTILNLSEKNSRIERAGKKMLNLVLGILDIRKFEEAEIKLELDVIDLHILTEQAIQEVEYLLAEKYITLNIDIPHGILIEVDVDIILRTVVNLLTNAIKYTPNNGTIALETSYNIEENNIHYKVVDTGEGISEKDISKIFTKFGQLKTKKSGKVRSTGLGLTFCKMAIEAHNGQIGVEAELGKGSTFWFNLNVFKFDNEKISLHHKSQKNYKEVIVLNENDKVFMQEFYPKIKSLDVYEYSEMKKILKDILLKQPSQNIKKWKLEIENAIHTCNEHQFNLLVDQLS